MSVLMIKEPFQRVHYRHYFRQLLHFQHPWN